MRRPPVNILMQSSRKILRNGLDHKFIVLTDKAARGNNSRNTFDLKSC